MNMDYAIQLGREALTVVMLVCGPMLGLGMLVGISISIFQATTQIQEQTLVFIPKILAVFFAVIVFGSMMLNVLVSFTTNLFVNVPNLIQ